MNYIYWLEALGRTDKRTQNHITQSSIGFNWGWGRKEIKCFAVAREYLPLKQLNKMNKALLLKVKLNAVTLKKESDSFCIDGTFILYINLFQKDVS